MESRLAVDGPEGPDTLVEFRDWLSEEPQLRGRVRVPASVPRPGDLGSWSDTLVVAVGAGGALTPLARALAVYLRQPRRSTVRVKVVERDGTRTELTVQHAKDVGEVEHLLRAALHPDSDAISPAPGGPADSES
ncbi:hypothetical protein OG735_13520 [Streptomyces sp. NBC_01210]|uniref:effector-associated constant component EACC1 n=1 Tax=Streptomyces sp. NBC_01210 TaxID=2903774 RepID=UPI002E1067AF|nr:hypothetical protein OG735_13520 [Streptomyces sp. NBC_01210]